jgi:hypothetical protein
MRLLYTYGLMIALACVFPVSAAASQVSSPLDRPGSAHSLLASCPARQFQQQIYWDSTEKYLFHTKYQHAKAS